MPPLSKQQKSAFKPYNLHIESATLRDIERVIKESGDSKRRFFRDAIFLHLERLKKVHGIK